MKMRKECRLWWPRNLSSVQPASCQLLFGWIFQSSSNSVDIVVAVAVNKEAISLIQPRLQRIVHDTNESMSTSLQDQCTFSLLGQVAADTKGNCQIPKIGSEECYQNGIRKDADLLVQDIGQLRCSCCNSNGELDHSRFVYPEKSSWIQLGYFPCNYIIKGSKWFPKLHYMRLDGIDASHIDLHVMLYDTPTYGNHHFSLGFPWPPNPMRASMKSPKWVEELHKRRSFTDSEVVILAINSANAAKLLLEKHVGLPRRAVRLPFFHLCFSIAWKLLALAVASLSTSFYITLQCIHIILCYGSQSWLLLMLPKLFSNTCKNIHIRCCQILYWPVLLKPDVVRSWTCVEYEEKAACRRHSMWMSATVDLLLGSILGFWLLGLAETCGLWISNISNGITNSLLRTGCVWLMGVPAGFKLNTELAEVHGVVSLNAIQIWSTLWLSLDSFLVHFIKGLAILAILFGLTTSAALTMDIILLATSHLSLLHWLTSNIYSAQIQSIAALWRLFRGRKWNPLRQRYDSYDYSVEQHVVGALLFTPLLLLLPTTSVFYTFFTIMKATISSLCSIIDIAIAIIHATPYPEILFWSMRRSRFPSGIWFQILSREANQSGVLVSVLHSNFLNINSISPLQNCILHSFRVFCCFDSS
ncbi:uncharacterized protein LOC124936116 isoform X2 [Impatiens glandulifera]|uniref:uncharacterized protein LOC124936116 isoform X2 n=1 Tax=Impatiens glandulifera TaxID=253017 RepID=UPI001FB0BBF9|nr:uncharacterized protein LOC124936116 isoform X2 [Impatiens glandulifera]